MMWAAVRSTETWWDIVRSVRPLFLAVTDRKASKIAEIRRVRTHLKGQIRDMVDLLGPQLYGPQFSSLRMFAPELRKHRHGVPFTPEMEARLVAASERLSVDGDRASDAGSELDDEGRASQGSEYAGSVDESEEHRYHEERELLVPAEVMQVLASRGEDPVGEEYRATLDAMAMEPLDAAEAGEEAKAGEVGEAGDAAEAGEAGKDAVAGEMSVSGEDDEGVVVEKPGSESESGQDNEEE
jgi:hypothetical protein